MVQGDFYPLISFDSHINQGSFLFDLNVQVDSVESVFPERVSTSIRKRYLDERLFAEQIAAMKRRVFAASKLPIYERNRSEQIAKAARFAGIEGLKIVNWFPRKELGVLEMIQVEGKDRNPRLRFQITDDGYLEANLYDCSTTGSAVALYLYGLRALRKIYGAFNIQSDFLPSLDFNDGGLQFSVPFRMPDGNPEDLGLERRLRDKLNRSGIDYTTSTKKGLCAISINGYDFNIESDSDNKGRFTAQIPYGHTSRDITERNSAAAHLFIAAASQGYWLYESMSLAAE